MGMMRHVVAVVRIAAAIISLWRNRHPISVGGVDAQQQPETASAASRRGYAARCSADCCCYAQLHRRCRGRKFAYFSTWKPYSSYNSWSNLLILSIDVRIDSRRLFLICVQMSKWQPFKVGNTRNFPHFSIWNREYGRQGIQKGLHAFEDRYVPAYQIWLWSIHHGRL